jgi:acyl carrier protein
MEDSLKRVMSDLFGISTDEINEESSIHTIEAWDSLKHMELVAAIEENFDIPMLSMDEIVEMTSFAKIIEILRNK